MFIDADTRAPALRPRLFRLIALCAALVGAGTAAHAQTARDLGAQAYLKTSLPRSVVVSIKGRQVPDLYGQLVKTMADSRFMKLTALSVRNARTLDEALKNTARLAGTGVSEVLNQYLCEANLHMCDPTGGRPQWRFRSAEPPPDGTRADCFAQEVPAGMICLPEPIVNPVASSIPIQFNYQRDSIAEIVKATGACTVYDAKCRQWTRRLNRREDDATWPVEYAGPMYVPATEYRIRLDVTSQAQVVKMLTALDNLEARLADQFKWPKDQRFLSHVVETVLSASGARTAGAFDDAWTATLSYPFKTSAELKAANYKRSVIGVWDNHVDDQHCALNVGNDKAIVLQSSLSVSDADPIRQPRGQCGDAKAALSLKWDHGTHVAGIIAARVGACPVFGANQLSQIWAVEVGDGSVLTTGDPIEDLAHGDTQIKTPDVINISMDEPIGGALSALESIVRSHSEDYLFVVASGTSKADRPELRATKAFECRIMPACLSHDFPAGKGVLSVVGLNADGTSRLTAPGAFSYYGPMFDVAAVGVATSTVDGNTVAAMAGSSMAAPYVTALASLIFSHPALKTRVFPREVKERVAYTADLENFDDIARYGRINFARALALETDVVTLKPSVACSTGCTFNGAIRAVNDEIVVTDAAEDLWKIANEDLPARVSDRRIKTADLRRIVRSNDGASDFYVIYKEGSVLRKLTGATFDATRPLQMKKTGDAAFTPVPFDSLKDFVAVFRR